MRVAARLLFVSAFIFSLDAQQPRNPGPYDLVIRGGRVVDGFGNNSWRADVAIQGDRIAAIGDLASSPRVRTVDATGLVVAPGFIDMHNHFDDSLLDEPKCESMIRQGVTTMVLDEGGSQGPIHTDAKRPWTTLGGYFDYVEKYSAAANIASYVGETQVWTYVKGEELSAATPDEKKQGGRFSVCGRIHQYREGRKHPSRHHSLQDCGQEVLGTNERDPPRSPREYSLRKCRATLKSRPFGYAPSPTFCRAVRPRCDQLEALQGRCFLARCVRSHHRLGISGGAIASGIRTVTSMALR